MTGNYKCKKFFQIGAALRVGSKAVHHGGIIMSNRSSALAVLLALAMLVAVSPAYSQFCTTLNYPVKAYASAVCLSDVNGDGRLDMIVGHVDHNMDSVTVMLAIADGLFGPGTNYFGGHYCFSIVAADFNGDGHNDFALCEAYVNQVTVFLNNGGTGAFLPGVAYPVAGAPSCVATADFDGDGSLDLAVISMGVLSGKLFVLLNDGSGVFGQRVEYEGVHGHSVATADFDHDGDADLVTSSPDNETRIFLNDGSGAFAPAVVYPNSAIPYTNDQVFTATADMDNDSYADIVVAIQMEAALSVLFNNGDGTFRAPVSYEIPGHTTSIAAADFNNDGHVDIILGEYVRTDVAVLFNMGDGSLTQYASLHVALQPDAVTAADIDADGDNDLITGNTYGSVSILYNRSIVAYACGDANSDAQVDISDVVFLIQYIFGGGPAPTSILLADTDCSSAVDISDAVHLIGYIFTNGFAPCAGK
jgi:hypothetical protein